MTKPQSPRPNQPEKAQVPSRNVRIRTLAVTSALRRTLCAVRWNVAQAQAQARALSERQLGLRNIQWHKRIDSMRTAIGGWSEPVARNGS